MPIFNPSFEDGGTRPGEAAHWTLVTSVAHERIAGFGPEPYCAWEDFERWSELFDDFDHIPVAIACFDLGLKRQEDFEDGFGNDAFLYELPSGEVEACRFAGNSTETFEKAWDNDAYAASWDLLASLTGSFGGKPREDFEQRWSGNDSYASSWEAVTSATAGFDAGTQSRETFEKSWPSSTSL